MNSANVVSVSGGKDSTATLLEAIEREAPNLKAVFADTGHEHEATYEYVQYLSDTVWPIQTVRADFSERMAGKREFIRTQWPKQGVPEERITRALEVIQPTGNPFLDMCLWKGLFPSTRRRFCSEELKVAPMMEQVLIPACRQYDLVFSWQGVRRDESRKRQDLPEMDQGDAPGLWNYRPILDWKAEDCFEMHRRHGVKWNPLYEQGMKRVGCMPCIHVNKLELREINARFREHIDRVADWEHLVSDASKKGKTVFFDGRVAAKHLGDDDIRPETHGIHEAVDWAKTRRGGKQYDLIAAIELVDVPVCSSVYGLCE